MISLAKLVRAVALSLLLAACQPSGGAPPGQHARAELVKAGPGALAPLMQSAAAQARTDSRRVVAYVGATWCEPCRYFLDALAADALPDRFADLRFIKFDFDVDEQRLQEAGFGGRMLPRFILVGPQGQATDRRFEGSIKGPQAVDDLVAKLDILLDTPLRDR